jgi:hypothetical protein
MMISRSQLLKRLAQERTYWRGRSHVTEFLKGIIYGLQIATLCVQAMEGHKVPHFYIANMKRKEKKDDR